MPHKRRERTTRSKMKSKKALKKGAGERKPVAKVTSHPRGVTSRREPFANVQKLDSHIFCLFVGQETRTLMTLHTKLLSTATRDFFASQPLYHGWHVLDDDIDIAQIWRHYLYFGEVCSKQANAAEEWEWLTDAYLLGIAVKDEKFCNAVISALIDKQIETSMPTPSLETVCANSS
ncbi:hypothetical protein AMS68_007610 [Peltaster fructicola]|uniref:Uncharacterized protein n=1 Tax=Peltaster fructicola TaxID=286661 RepID=A0A6H0Y516_9PEZI|nr:hypothetical protein AMS68_007610 [Peltaster fructicola]